MLLNANYFFYIDLNSKAYYIYISNNYIWLHYVIIIIIIIIKDVWKFYISFEMYRLFQKNCNHFVIY